MSNRSKNLLATVAVIGMAAIASSPGLQTQSAPTAAPIVLASLDR
jgi:hypothetical protein